MNRKNIIYAGLAMFFAACSSNEKDEPTSQVPLSIDATLSSATRGEAVTSFAADSQLGVYMGDYTNCLFTTSDGTTFTPATSTSASNIIYFDSETEEVEAYYPYSEETSVALDATSDDGLPDILYAKGTGRLATGKAKLQFNHLLSRITFQLTLGDGFSAALSYKLTLSGLVAQGTFNAPSEVTLSNEVTASDITAKGSFYSTAAAITSTCSLMVLPQTPSGDVTLTCQFDENGPEFTATVPLTAALDAGNNYVFSARIDKNGLTVTGSGVTEWENFPSKTAEASYVVINNPTKVRRYDYAMDDGTFIMGAAPLTEDQKKRCVGIVYWTIYEDDSQGFLTGNVLKNDYPNCNHGLIMSLNNAVAGTIQWQKSTESVYDQFQNTTNFTDDNKSSYRSIRQSGTDDTIDQFQYLEGYANTKLLKQYNTYCDNNSKSSYKVLPVTLLDDFTTKYPAPANSTGWYLPTVKEMLLYDATDRSDMKWEANYNGPIWAKANAQITNLGREDTRIVNSYYWSSEESTDASRAWYIDMYSTNGDYTPSSYKYLGNSGTVGKVQQRCVRFICAF